MSSPGLTSGIHIQENLKMSSKMKLSDCKCPICMCIFIEPVTMPCRHQLCIKCFRKNVEEASLTCPMCRTRISTWARKAAKNKGLVDEKFWKKIQECFPLKVQNRLEGKEDDNDSSEEEADDLPFNYLQLSTPGAIREEYEKEVKQIEQEKIQKEQEEFAASQKLIDKLKEEEENEFQLRNKELEKQNLKDEALAKEINDAINVSITNADSPEPIQMLSSSSKKYNKGTPVRKTTMLDKFITRETRSTDMSTPNARQEREQGSPWESFLDSEKNTMEFTFADSRTASRSEKLPSLDFPHLDLKGDDSLLNTDDVMPGALGDSGKEASVRESLKHDSRHGEVNTSGLLDSKCDPSHMQILASSSSASSCSDSSWSDTKVASSSRQSSSRVLPSEVTSENSNSDSISRVKSSHENSESTAKVKSVETTTTGNSCWKPSINSKTSTASTVTKSSNKPPPDYSTKPLTIIDKLKRQRSTSVDSSDSISMEFLHFKPIHRSPLTPPKRLPGGKVLEAPIIRSTPINISRQNSQSDTEGTCLSPQNPVGSPIMLVRLQELAAERQEQVTLHSKGTSTDSEKAIKRDHSYSSPSALSEKMKKDKGLQRNMKPKGLWKQRAESSATVSTFSGEVAKLNMPQNSAFQDMQAHECTTTTQKSLGCEIIPLEPNIEDHSGDSSLPQFFQNFGRDQTGDTLVKQAHNTDMLTSSGNESVTSVTNNTASQTGAKGSAKESSTEEVKSSNDSKMLSAKSPGKVYKMKKSPVCKATITKNVAKHNLRGTVDTDENVKNIKSWLKKVQNPEENSEHYSVSKSENETSILEENVCGKKATGKMLSASSEKIADSEVDQSVRNIDRESELSENKEVVESDTLKSDECIVSRRKRKKKENLHIDEEGDQCDVKAVSPQKGKKSNRVCDRKDSTTSDKKIQPITATEVENTDTPVTPKSPRTRKGSGIKHDPIVVSSAEVSTKKKEVVTKLWRSPRKKKLAETFAKCDLKADVRTSPRKRESSAKEGKHSVVDSKKTKNSTDLKENKDKVVEMDTTKRQDKRKKTGECNRELSCKEEEMTLKKSKTTEADKSETEGGKSEGKKNKTKFKCGNNKCVTNENKKTRKSKDIEYSPSDDGKTLKRTRNTSNSDPIASHSPKSAKPCRHKSSEKFAVEYSPTDDGKKRRKLSTKNGESDLNVNIQQEKKKKGHYQTKLFFVTEMKSDDSDFETEKGVKNAKLKRKLVFGKKIHKEKIDDDGTGDTKKLNPVTKKTQKGKGAEIKGREESDEELPSDQMDTQPVEKCQGLHTERLAREHFKTDSEYAAYVEEQDGLLALQLQADFNMEARFNLSAIRSKGSEGQYKLREKRKRTAKADGIKSLSPKKRACKK